MKAHRDAFLLPISGPWWRTLSNPEEIPICDSFYLKSESSHSILPLPAVCASEMHTMFDVGPSESSKNFWVVSMVWKNAILNGCINGRMLCITDNSNISLSPSKKREQPIWNKNIWLTHYWTLLGIRFINNRGITRIASNYITVTRTYCFFLATFSSRRIATLEMSPHRFDKSSLSLWKQRSTNSNTRSPWLAIVSGILCMHQTKKSVIICQ